MSPSDLSTGASKEAVGDAPEADRQASERRTRVLVALPLAISLLVAGCLLWVRSEPTRRGDFCSRATVEAGKVLRAADGAIRVQYNSQTQIDAVLAQAYVADIDQLVDGAPEPLRTRLERAAGVLDEHRADRAAAAERGDPPPEPPEQLREVLLDFLVTYEEVCI